MKRMSPVKTVRSPGTWTSTSPRVWAGPTWISSIFLSPTERDISPSNVRVGGVCRIPSNSKGPKHLRKNWPSGLWSTAIAFIRAAIASGGSSVISSAAAAEAMISAPSTSWLP